MNQTNKSNHHHHQSYFQNKIILFIFVIFTFLFIFLLILLLLAIFSKETSNVELASFNQYHLDNFSLLNSDDRIKSSSRSFISNTIKSSNQAYQDLRIVGGLQAVPHSWPSAVFIKFDYKTNVFLDNENKSITVRHNSICGGTLVKRNVVLTAAHCFPDKLNFRYNSKNYSYNIASNSLYPSYESMFKVYLGLHNRSMIELDLPSIYPAVEMKVKKLIKHEKYDPNNMLYDIGLIILSKDAILNQFIQIACLPIDKPFSYPEIDTLSYVIGWGRLSQDGVLSDVLNNLLVKIHNPSLCDTILGTIKLWDTQVCAGLLIENKSACKGDSGGPLLVREVYNNQIKFIVSGIVSYGSICGHPDKPNVYTRVAYFIEWINRNMNAEI